MMCEMKKYQWILFDADDTLFHFDAFRGLVKMFSQFGITFDEHHFKDYQKINQDLWIQYQNGSISAKEVKHGRFQHWSEKLKISPAQLNGAFLESMAEICQPLEGVPQLLEELKGNTKLGVITNGFVELQEIRLERTGLKHYFDILVISEQVGMPKPHLKIFEHAHALMGHPPKHEILMVGDNIQTDILGGNAYGMDTCWLNIHKKPLPKEIQPTFQAHSYEHLRKILVRE